MEHAEWRRVIRRLGPKTKKIICDRCKVTLTTYADRCLARIGEPCQASDEIEKAKAP